MFNFGLTEMPKKGKLRVVNRDLASKKMRVKLSSSVTYVSWLILSTVIGIIGYLLCTAKYTLATSKANLLYIGFIVLLSFLLVASLKYKQVEYDTSFLYIDLWNTFEPIELSQITSVRMTTEYIKVLGIVFKRYRIDFKEGAQPVQVYFHCRLSSELLEELEEKIKHANPLEEIAY